MQNDQDYAASILLDIKDEAFAKTSVLSLCMGIMQNEKFKDRTFTLVNDNQIFKTKSFSDNLKITCEQLAITGLSNKQSVGISMLLEKMQNLHLKTIINDLLQEEKSCASLGENKLFLANFCNALVRSGKNIVFECPNINFSQENMQVIQAALSFEVTNRQRNLFIKTSNPAIWLGSYSYKAVLNNNKLELQKTTNAFQEAETRKPNKDSHNPAVLIPEKSQAS